MGLQINQLIFSITLATLFSTIAGISAAFLLSKTKNARRTDPMKNPGAEGVASASETTPPPE